MTTLTDFTVSFFKWASEQGLSSQDIADELGSSRVVVSNWRSKSLPKGKEYACRAFMDKVAREKGEEVTDWSNQSAIKPIEVREDGQ